MKRIFLILLLVMLCPAFAQAEPLINTSAKQAIVLDYETGMVLLEKNADEQMPTSSMSKVMTMYLVFDALKKGDLSLDDTYQVSEKAWRKGGSKMFVEVDKRVKVEDLIRGVVIQSGNDATIVLAEGLAGSEEAFANGLNAKAAELGMTHSNFANASGWPDPNHYSTARDLATLATATIQNFPNYYPYYAEQEFTYNNITQKNRNPLLYRNIGADGVKTGHTEAGGYGLIGSGTHQGRRVVLVVNGLADEKARAQESAKLLEWGLKSFDNIQLFTAQDVVETATVALGQEKSVPAVLQEDLKITIPKIAVKEFTVSAQFNEPLIAPIAQGDKIGVLRVDIPHMGTLEHDLYAGSAVPKLGFFASTIAKAKNFISAGKD
ncbi:MAG: D-alanyl-D-alanine carboxypeptidase [Alphaproteobacteria bacterium]|nr:D-alanyl-D-alanine carboxypeptidase [Alphaproteobacteria bacterium]